MAAEKQQYNFNITNPFIFIDIDKTLITNHTRGTYSGGNIYNLIDKTTLKRLTFLLETLKNVYHVELFINTRGNYDSVVMLLNNLGLKHLFDDDHILSAQMPQYVMDKYDIEERYEIQSTIDKYTSTVSWAILKTYFMDKVLKKTRNYDKFKGLSSFFDDTVDNVKLARENGYVKAQLVDNTKIESSLVTYLENIVNLEKELDLFRKHNKLGKYKK